jgi:hypothetical protein
MDEPVPDDALNEMERRCAAATAGPWNSYIEGRDHWGGDSFIQTGGEDIYLQGATHADQDFIARARQDLPALIQEIRRLRRLIGDKA